jgi:ribosomal protein L12E/L44/L45/RPP1/RPP2
MSSSSELACVYAALIMADDGIEVTAENIKKACEAAGVEVEGYLPGLFAKAVGSVDIKELISNIGSGGGGGGGGGGDAAPAADGAAAAEPVAAAPKEESEEEDMGFGLFD